MNKEYFIGSRLSWLLGGAVRRTLVLGTLVLCGCGSEKDPEEPLMLRMAHVYDVTAPTHAYGADLISERIRQKTDDLDVTVYPSGQLGTEAELLEQLVAGELDIAISGPAFLGMWHPPIGVLDAAFATRDLDHMLEVARSKEMAPEWEALRNKYDVRVLDTWAYGSRHLTSNVPIRHPDDLDGFRLRMPGSKTFQSSGEALGASPMPIAFSEVYVALNQGIADGQENPVPVIKSMGFHEVQDYLNLTGHIQSSVQILVNERTWKRLTPNQRQMLSESVQELGVEVYEGLVRDEKKLIKEWQKDGAMEIIDDVDVDAFRERCRKYFSKGFAFSDVYNRITADPSEGDSE